MIVIFGFAILVFLSFLLGVKVGMNIETYPREIAWGIPAKIVRLLGIPKSPSKVEVPPIVPAPSVPSEPEPSAAPQPEVPPAPSIPVTSAEAVPPPTPATSAEAVAPPPPSATEAKPTPPTTKEGAYIVQLGSFRDEKKAQEVMAKLKALGFHGRIRILDLPGKGRWHQVVMGRFASKAEAEKAIEKVTAQVKGLDCVIRRVDKGH